MSLFCSECLTQAFYRDPHGNRLASEPFRRISSASLINVVRANGNVLTGPVFLEEVPPESHHYLQ